MYSVKHAFLFVCFSGERMETHSQILDRLRSAFRSGITGPEAFRQAQLKQLMSLMTENEDQILDALKKDLAKVQHCSRDTHTDRQTDRQLHTQTFTQPAKGLAA